jgi:formylglycine-generating enzyme required for sulfatase activity
VTIVKTKLMKNKKTLRWMFSGVICALILLFSSFKHKGDFLKLPKSLKENYAYVPGGKLILDEDPIEITAFYMSKYEVSNKEYNAFLDYLKESGAKEAYTLAQIDSGAWAREEEPFFNEPFKKHYHQHPAYANYPVVNITKEAAALYCEWLSKQVNGELENEAYRVTLRLPTKEEWLKAAMGKNRISTYSWGSPYLRNEKGQFMCNFKSLGSESIYYDEESKSYKVKRGLAILGKDNAMITAPVNAYSPSELGIYNLNGNVAEMTSNGLACGGSWNSAGYDVRNQSAVPFEEASPTVGFRPVIIIEKK